MKVIENRSLDNQPSTSRTEQNDSLVGRLDDSKIVSSILELFLSAYFWQSNFGLLLIPINIEMVQCDYIMDVAPKFEKSPQLKDRRLEVT